ncbi:MAG: M20/M25/M40 family metallo-hydrolase [Myxococcota bacterium]
MTNLQELLQRRCLELLSIPSVTGQENAITSHLEAWAHSLSVFANGGVRRLGNNLVLGQPSDKPLIALVGHTDTVPPTADYNGPKQDGDRIIGLGASDMKGSIAVMQVLIEQLDIAKLPFSLLLILYDKEEGPYADNGLQPVLDAESWLSEIDLAIAMEPTDNTLQLGCVGSIQAEVIFHGKAAHSARPWQGDNAIHHAAPLLEALRNRPVRSVDVDGLIFIGYNATLAHGSRARNVIPDRFTVTLNSLCAQGQHRKRYRERPRRVACSSASSGILIKDIAPQDLCPRATHWNISSTAPHSL